MTAPVPAAGLHTGVPDGAALIAAERRRQIDVEGWTPEHDAEHDDHDLVFAAVCYATPEYARFLTSRGFPADWPWEPEAWKRTPDDRVRELVKAGALIAAEIDRLRALAVARADPQPLALAARPAPDDREARCRCADDYCYDRRVGAKCLICEHTDCGNCPECSPEVPD